MTRWYGARADTLTYPWDTLAFHASAIYDRGNLSTANYVEAGIHGTDPGGDAPQAYGAYEDYPHTAGQIMNWGSVIPYNVWKRISVENVTKLGSDWYGGVDGQTLIHGLHMHDGTPADRLVSNGYVDTEAEWGQPIDLSHSDDHAKFGSCQKKDSALNWYNWPSGYSLLYQDSNDYWKPQGNSTPSWYTVPE